MCALENVPQMYRDAKTELGHALSRYDILGQTIEQTKKEHFKTHRLICDLEILIKALEPWTQEEAANGRRAA